MTAGQKVTWRGEIVIITSVRGPKAQIAWASGLRWVRLSELMEAI